MIWAGLCNILFYQQTVYKGISKAFQVKGSSILGQPPLRNTLLLDKEVFLDGESLFVQRFLSEVTCNGVPCKKFHTLINTVETPVIWNGIELHQGPPFQMGTVPFNYFQYPVDYLEG